MTATSSAEAIDPRTLFYHRERLRNRIFDCVIKVLAERARLGQANKMTVAKRLGKDPAQISRWLGGPTNWTIDTISDLMLALDAELLLDQRLVEHLPTSNFKHPLTTAPSTTSEGLVLDVKGASDQQPKTGSRSQDVSVRLIPTL